MSADETPFPLEAFANGEWVYLHKPGGYLFRSDGTPGGTASLGVAVGKMTGNTSQAILGALDERVYFVGDDPQFGWQIWVTDGSVPGTQRLSGSTNSLIGNVGIGQGSLVSSGLERLFFTAIDDVHGAELWSTDGSAASTHLVADLTPGAVSSHFLQMRERAAKIYVLEGTDLLNRRLFVSDGTAEGSAKLLDTPGINGLSPIFQTLLFFVTPVGGSASLWKTDGTIAGTVKVATFPAGAKVVGSHVAPKRLFFGVETAADGRELWTSDGTAAGTKKISHFSDPQAFDTVTAAALVDERLVLPVYDPVLGGEIWASDGTAAGTIPVTACPGACGFSKPFWPYIVSNGKGEAVFSFGDPEHGDELWRTEGTVAGTRRLTDICPGTCSGGALAPRPLAGGWIFGADDGVHDLQVWWTDGESEPERVTDFPLNWERGIFDGAAAAHAFVFGADDHVHGDEAWGVVVDPENCVPDARTVCLNGSRFRVRARQQAAGSPLADAHPVKLTDDSGYFWFFEPDNVELVVKLLDACGTPAENFWAFAAGLTNVRVELEVKDVVTGEIRTYINPQNQAYRLLADTGHFHGCSVEAAATRSEATAAIQATCTAGEDVLCLNQGRFEVRAEWEIAGGQSGIGHAHVLTDDTGYFWFFDPTNLEVVLKVLDACSLAAAPRYWVFAAGLTNVEVTLTVTDTQTHTVKQYHNDLNQDFRAIQDTSAFATCP